MSHYCDLKRVAGDGGISTSSKIKAFLTFMLWFCLTTFVSVFSLVSIFVLAWMEVSSLSSCGNSRKNFYVLPLQVFSAELLSEKVGRLGGEDNVGTLVVVLPILFVCLKAPLNLIHHLLTFKWPRDEFGLAYGLLNAVFPSR